MINKSAQIKPRTISLFSGCGGLDIGFHQAGFDIVFQMILRKPLRQPIGII
jgi:DNA (cytosine-5)-methyltransferase 1